jgi:hypothetical protein
MSVTVILLLSFFLWFPGYLFIRSYYSSDFSIKFTQIDIYHEVIYSLIPSFIIHFIFYHFAKWLGYIVPIKQIVHIIPQNFPGFINEIFVDTFFMYNVIVWTFAILTGHFARVLVKYCGWDLLFESLRYPNQYYYLLNGGIKDINQITQEKKKFRLFYFNQFRGSINLINVDVLVNTDYGLLIYRGLLYHYILGPQNSLDKIILAATYKAKYNSDDCNSEHEFKEVSGNNFVIPGSCIVNINLSYFQFQAHQNNQTVQPDVNKPAKPAPPVKDPKEKTER